MQMDILKIVETLQSYSGEGEFAEAVANAVDLLIEQGERIADLENQIATVNGGWIPVSLGFLPEEHGSYLCRVKSTGGFCQTILQYDMYGFRNGHIYTDDVTHWMPLPGV